MNNKFALLNCDDVVLLGKDAFKVSILKDLLEQEIRNKLQQHIYESNSLAPGVSMLEFFSQISIGKRKINLMDIQHNYITDCQVLRIGEHGWEKGNLKIQIGLSAVNQNQSQICLEFGYEEPIEYDFLLDEICELIAEK